MYAITDNSEVTQTELTGGSSGGGGVGLTSLVEKQDIGQKQVGSQYRQKRPEGIRQAAKCPKSSWGQSL